MSIKEKLERKIQRLQSFLLLAEEKKKHWKVLKLNDRLADAQFELAQMELAEKAPKKETLKVKAGEQRSAEYFDLWSARGFRADRTRLHRVTRGQADRKYYGYYE